MELGYCCVELDDVEKKRTIREKEGGDDLVSERCGIQEVFKMLGYTGIEIAPAGEPLICLGTTIKQAGTDITSKVESLDITIVIS